MGETPSSAFLVKATPTAEKNRLITSSMYLFAISFLDNMTMTFLWIYMKKVPARTARRDNFCFELISLAPVNHALSRFSAANALVAELFLFKRNAS